MPIYFWGDDGRLALPRELLRRSTPACGATATGSRSPSAARRSSRPLRRDDQPRRHPDGHGRDLPRGAGASTRSSTRSSSTCRARAATAGCRCSSSCARARRSTTSSSPRSARAIREDCSPRHVPNEVIAVAEVPRTLSGKVLELPVKRILMGTPAEQGAAQPRLAREPRRRSLPFEELAVLGSRMDGRMTYLADGRSLRPHALPPGRAQRPKAPR